MKLKLALAVAALQVLVLAFMAGQREWISRTGTPVILRTAPVDPNDPMRGAYVRLNYEASFVPASLCRGAVAAWAGSTDYRLNRGRRDAVVYATLQANAHGIAEVTSLSDQRPASGPFLKGRVESVEGGGVRVRYGIEALFMNKAAAVRTEQEGFKREGAPMNVRVAVGSNGTAVLRDFEWEPVGLTFAIDRPQFAPNDPQRWQPRPLTGMTVTLHNYGDKDVAIVDRPNGQAFRMIPNTRFGQNHYAWAGEKAGAPDTGAPNIIVLKPGAKHSVHLDFSDRRWWVVDTRKENAEPIPMAKVPQGDAWNASFRLEYAPPPAEAVRGLPNADLIRHAPLRSRAFNAAQGVD